MYCKKCGAKLKDGQKFCTYCGTPVSVAHTPGVDQNYRMGASGATSNQTVYYNNGRNGGQAYAASNQTTFFYNGRSIEQAFATTKADDIRGITAIILAILIPVMILMFYNSNIGGYWEDSTIYNKNGLQIEYLGSLNSEYYGSDYTGLSFSVVNNTGKAITDISAVNMKIDNTNMTGMVYQALLDVYGYESNEIKTGEMGQYIIVIDNSNIRRAGADPYNISKYELTMLMQYELNGELTSESIGPFTLKKGSKLDLSL